MPEPSEPTRAAALRYSGAGAPEVVATGRGEVADRILARAREAGVPVRADADLAAALAALALGEEVPEALWVAVARVLAWAYEVDARAGSGQA